MNLNKLTPRKSLNKAFLKVKPTRSAIECFKHNLITLIDQIDEKESEEFHKTIISVFLRDTYYGSDYYINTKGRNDLVIHNGKDAQSTVGIIIETKKPSNKAEMLTVDNINAKALQEMVLYYLRERITLRNIEIKYLIATNIYEWFIFDAAVFENAFAKDKHLVKQFTDFEEGRLSGTTTDFFYKQIAEPAILGIKSEITFVHFDIREYETPLRNTDKKDDTALVALYKLLSPEHLLKLPFANDSNSLDKSFYTELLHIIGLEEIRESGKKLIQRKKENERNTGSLIESAINQLECLDKISRLENPDEFGETQQDRLYAVALELTITWINRILFLKLLEAQQINYHKGDKSYAFLNHEKVKGFDDLNGLFFNVLARKPNERSKDIKKLFGNVPYLNSSLFEPTSIEQVCFFISQLKDEQIPILSTTVLKDTKGNKRTGYLNTLEYLFEFLDAYDFSNEGVEEIQEENKALISASVLGLIFEKINGYKDGSFFTPGFITMYMCRETIRRAVVQKFNETKKWNCKDLNELFNTIEDKKEANAIINSLKICDPAVGSGHFLVSALNEIIAIKSDLQILLDKQGRTLRDYQVEVQNDDLIVTDDGGNFFDYNPKNKESQNIQETLFHEKETIIENCLFGVDINHNSVKICRLRLWIELLKNAYYTADSGYTELETLPNIDINIKCGNSLISRYALDSDIKKALRKSKWNIETYRLAIMSYQNAKTKEEKREMEKLINEIKHDFEASLIFGDPRLGRLEKRRGELHNLTMQTNMFGMTPRQKQEWEKKVEKATKALQEQEQEIQDVKNSKIYHNAFEWRFEFPEVLNDEGEFVGFDVVIGNPPYIRQEEIKNQKQFLQLNYKTYSGTADLYVFFVERGFEILKNSGHFCYIMPNKWMQAGYGKSLRTFFLKNSLQSVVDFGDLQVFEEATTYPCILNAAKMAQQGTFNSCAVKTLLYINDFEKYVTSITTPIPTGELSDETWIISSGTDQKLLVKIKEKCVSLSEYIGGEAHYGIKTGLTEAFLVDDKTKKEMIAKDSKSAELLKPVLLGRTIKKWHAEQEGLWLIGTFPALNLKIDDYPQIRTHLLVFGKERLDQTGAKGSRKKTNNKWFETQDTIVYWKEFEKPKIMYQIFQVKPCFIYDEQGLYCNNSIWIISKADKTLVAILNSKIGWWLISKYCTAIQNGYQLIWQYFGQIPIPKVGEKQSKPITAIVNKILAAKKKSPNADTTALENEIDQLVYKLYGLTEDEIKIVEGKKL
jgi:hypothetical protein